MIDRRPDPPPLETDDVKIVALGTAVWAVAFVVVLVLRLTGKDVQDWWLAMCGAGALRGLLGVRYCVRRRNALGGA
ncbi:MAG: DUF2530 domain-containing protein [Mycobacteriales bacterium]